MMNRISDIKLVEEDTRNEFLVQSVVSGYEAASARRTHWESLWNECYDYALPQRNRFGSISGAGQEKSDHLYDATAMDAVDQLAASLLGQLTPYCICNLDRSVCSSRSRLWSYSNRS